MERILEQAPRFFSGPNLMLLLEAAGLTLATIPVIRFLLVRERTPGGEETTVDQTAGMNGRHWTQKAPSLWMPI